MFVINTSGTSTSYRLYGSKNCSLIILYCNRHHLGRKRNTTFEFHLHALVVGHVIFSYHFPRANRRSRTHIVPFQLGTDRLYQPKHIRQRISFRDHNQKGLSALRLPILRTRAFAVPIRSGIIFVILGFDQEFHFVSINLT